VCQQAKAARQDKIIQKKGYVREIWKVRQHGSRAMYTANKQEIRKTKKGLFLTGTRVRRQARGRLTSAIGNMQLKGRFRSVRRRKIRVRTEPKRRRYCEGGNSVGGRREKVHDSSVRKRKQPVTAGVGTEKALGTTGV